MGSKLSVVINAQNGEKDLPRVLNSVKYLANEIIVVDQNSTDNTIEVSKKYGAKVFKHKSVIYVELARNFAISKATNEWVLVLDPDEEISMPLSKKIKQAIADKRIDYYAIPRKNIVFGKWLKYSRWWPDYNIRLFRKGKVNWTEEIHRVPITQGVGADFESKEEFAIIHNHYDSIDQYLERMHRYTSVQSENLKREGYKFMWNDLLKKPASEFLSRYFFGEGYKDGIHGLSLSFLQAFSELVVYLKIWQAEKFTEQELELNDVVDEMKNLEKDLHYWQNDSLFKKTGNLTARIKRKLRI